VGERGLREVLVPLLAVAVVSAAGGYALRGWLAAESTDAADARLASDASVSSAPEGASNSGELAGLRGQLREERDRRSGVEAKLRDLREEVAQLVSAYQEEAELEEAAGAAASASSAAAGALGDAALAPSAGQSAALPRPKGVSMSALLAAGFGNYEAEQIRERIEGIVMRQLQLLNQARREGWEKKPRYARASRAIGSEFGEMREDYGEDRFDWILYASGRKNRVVVDSVFGQSAAGEADLRPGDLILRYGESRIFNGKELRQATIEGDAGQLVPVEYERAGEVHRVFLPRGPVGVQLHEATLSPNSS
jgi:hypothetical protein